MRPKDLKLLKKDLVIDTILRGNALKFHTTWGLFSPEGIDEGSRMLIDEVEVKSTDTILDIGCGYGPIGIALAKLAPEGTIQMIDKDFVAIDYAKKNIELNGLKNCESYLSNAFSNVPSNIEFDIIVSNLPAKVSGEMLSIIMLDAQKHLKKGGKFYVVVIAGLKEYIKRNFLEIFGNFDKIKQGKTYMVASATKL